MELYARPYLVEVVIVVFVGCVAGLGGALVYFSITNVYTLYSTVDPQLDIEADRLIANCVRQRTSTQELSPN